jgi:signal transduction histidine kinase
VREVCRSQPTFRKRLLFASVLFAGLFVADLFVVAPLAWSDLSHRVIDEGIRESLHAVQSLYRRPASEGLPSIPVPATPAEPCPLADALSVDQVIPCPTAHPPRERPSIPKVFATSTIQVHRMLVGGDGRLIWREFTRISAGEVNREGRALMPGHSEVRDEWMVDSRPQPVIAFRAPADPESGQITEIAFPASVLDERVVELERSLQMKLWIGAGVAALVLIIAFLYVLRLLQRTRLLEAQAQMDDRLAYVGGLAAGLAHEIRNPLNVLSMNLQMLEEEVAARVSGDAGELREYLSALQAEIRRLSSLVNNFLSYARPNQPCFATRDLNQLIGEIVVLVRPEFEARDITLRQELSPFLPHVDLDEAQIRQAIMNILMNTTQILKPGGTVVIHSGVGEKGEVVATIEDDGPGIKPEDRQKVFEVFFSTRGGGTGLGLPIAARIMEAHGGTIDVESEPGRGARFILTLPRRHAGAGATAGSGAIAAAGPS